MSPECSLQGIAVSPLALSLRVCECAARGSCFIKHHGSLLAQDAGRALRCAGVRAGEGSRCATAGISCGSHQACPAGPAFHHSGLVAGDGRYLCRSLAQGHTSAHRLWLHHHGEFFELLRLKGPAPNLLPHPQRGMHCTPSAARGRGCHGYDLVCGLSAQQGPPGLHTYRVVLTLLC